MAAMIAAVALPRGLRRLFSTSITSTFMPPPPTSPWATGGDISGLGKRTTTEKLREAFSQFGEAVNARVVTYRVSGYSKGFGFVRYATIEEAAKGIEGMDGKEKEEAPKEPPQQRQKTLQELMDEHDKEKASDKDVEVEEGPAPQATLEELLDSEGAGASKKEDEGWTSFVKKAWKGVIGRWGRGPPAEQAPPGGPEGGPPAQPGGYPDPPHWPDY